MAINVEIIESNGMGRQPGGVRAANAEVPAKITNVSAAGETALQAATQVVTIRNRTGGDSVYALLRLAGSTQAAAGNSHLLAAGQSVTYSLAKGKIGTDYEVDIRATS